ncbi:hypothetical protein MicB006_3367 [Micromonospora sp. B006]|nr:hypothetical protein MicB006_3367 [Micromonospora sp. B006]
MGCHSGHGCRSDSSAPTDPSPGTPNDRREKIISGSGDRAPAPCRGTRSASASSSLPAALPQRASPPGSARTHRLRKRRFYSVRCHSCLVRHIRPNRHPTRPARRRRT